MLSLFNQKYTYTQYHLSWDLSVDNENQLIATYNLINWDLH